MPAVRGVGRKNVEVAVNFPQLGATFLVRFVFVGFPRLEEI
jgi:hypothetical protein